jgi:hypothetical protein
MNCYLGLGDSWLCFFGFWIAIAYQVEQQTHVGLICLVVGSVYAVRKFQGKA